MYIDIGATKIKAVSDGMTAVTKTPQKKEEFILILNHIIKTFESEKIKTINIGYPGIISRGIITKSHNIPALLGVNIKKSLNTKIPINFYNDAELFLKIINHANNFDAAITLGSGVGVAIKRNNKYQNLEYGHKQVTIGGKKKEFEYFLGGLNIKKHYKKNPREAWRTSKKMQSEFIEALEKLINRLEKEFKIKSLVLGGRISKLPILDLLKIKFKNKIIISRHK